MSVAEGTLIVLFFTFGAIIWYSWETRRLANLTAKQIKINIRPFIVVLRRARNLHIKNIGNSSALNISVRDIIREYIDPEDRKHVYKFKFNKKTELGPGDDTSIPITVFHNDTQVQSSGEVNNAISSFLSPHALKEGESYELIINYNDVEGGKWRSVTVADNKGENFKEVKE